MLNNKFFHAIIKELCEEQNVKMEVISYGWILKLSKGNKVKYIVGNNFPLNPESSSIIISDKYATYEVLNSFGIPAVKHIMLFNPAERGEYISENGNFSIISSEFSKYGKLVVKPNTGFEGNNVMLCKSLKEAEIAIHKLFKTENSISICPYYEIEREYRAFYLNGKVELIYSKEKPYVVGDGKSSLKELITKENLPEKPVVKENLALLDMKIIPGIGQKVELSWKHNLSGGAKAEILEENTDNESTLYNEIKRLAIKAGEALDIKFVTIDIIHTTENELYVLEVNRGVSTAIFANTVKNGTTLVKNIFRNALNEMFK